jgi:hypothetical protein
MGLGVDLTSSLYQWASETLLAFDMAAVAQRVAGTVVAFVFLVLGKLLV